MLHPHFIIAEGFQNQNTMEKQTKTKEERFEKVVKYERGFTEYYTDWLIFILLFPVFMIAGYVLLLMEYFQDKRKVYWRKIKWTS